MNRYIKTSVALAVAALTFTGCEDLDVVNKSKYVTSDDKEATLKLNPGVAAAGVAGVSATVKQYMSVYENHFDFGYAATMLGLDLQGQDMVGDWSGYNWFRYWEGFTSPTPTGTPSSEAWYVIYSQIFACNALCESISPDTEEAELQFYRGQALLTRGFDYWVLAQLYQLNYKGHESAPCVPIVTNENKADVQVNGAPRATVEETYKQVLKDLDEAIDLIAASGLQPDDVMSSKPKRYGSLATAYGMRARVYLTMHKYAEAAADADAAIANFRGSVLSMSGAAQPGFWSIDEADWMWGIPVEESDRIVTSGIVNWPSMMNTFCANGYVNVGAWKDCNVDLYEQIPATDVRKGWFLDENGVSANLTAQQQRYIDSQDSPVRPYTNVKFIGYQGVAGQTTNANDIPLMRIEEMYLIKAEGLAMSGQTTQAAEFLTNFVQSYRNPNYTCEATDAEGIQQEVLLQRRVELWGEGLSWFDVMRLDLEINRKGCNWPEEAAFRIPSAAAEPDKAYVRIYCIPQGEINGNKALTTQDNNPSGPKPDPATWN
ncbi:MAG: RagB/SusD family nutrient uptake outer membrane protein [Bacteroidales bacterium]|nr:RagB/SusD family nutrient uptake outer membrane protein [Bacteroidales bacterium]